MYLEYANPALRPPILALKSTLINEKLKPFSTLSFLTDSELEVIEFQPALIKLFKLKSEESAKESSKEHLFAIHFAEFGRYVLYDKSQCNRMYIKPKCIENKDYSNL